MTTASAIIIMVICECMIILVLALSPTPFRMRGIGVVLNMLAIAIFGQGMMDVGFGVSNITNVCFAAAVAAQCVILERHGPQGARTSIPMVQLSVAAFFLLSWAIGLFPAVPGNDANEHIRALVTHAPTVMVASFASFFLSQEILIRVWRRLVDAGLSPAKRCMLAAFACQAIDTPVFFITAFSHVLPPMVLSDAMAVGFLVKCAVGVVMAPVVVVAIDLPERVAGLRLQLDDWSAK